MMESEVVARDVGEDTAGNDIDDLGAALEVGNTVFLDLKPGEGKAHRYKTYLRGWGEGAYIILEAPARCAPLIRQGQPCAIRFMRDGEVWGFPTRVSDTAGNGPKKTGGLIRFDWPCTASRVRARRHPRVALLIPCFIHLADGSQIWGRVCDLSAGGCSIQVKTGLLKDTELSISFDLPDGIAVERLAVAIRNQRPSGDGESSYGVQFLNMEESENYGIDIFVTRTLACSRGPQDAEPVFLVLSKTLSDARLLRDALGENSLCEVLLANCFVDLCSLLTKMKPKALFLHAEQAELPAVEMCRIVKNTSGFESLPLVLYGPGESDTVDSAAATPADFRMKDLSGASRLGLLEQEEAVWAQGAQEEGLGG